MLPLVTEWFRLRDVAPGLTQIDEPYAHEFVRGNIWWRRGAERDLIVDTGLGVSSLKNVLRAVTEAGGRPWREPIVVLTHGHLDHAGGAAEFDDVRAHPSDVPAAVASLHAPTFARQIGLPPDPALPSGLFVSATPREGWDPTQHAVGLISPSPLHDADIIDLGDRRYEVLHMPGHTHGSVVLIDREHGELFSGDVAYDDYLLDQLHESDPGAYLESMQKLSKLKVDSVRPGHGASFNDFVLQRITGDYILRSRQPLI